jgi:hypothetical protein
MNWTIEEMRSEQPFNINPSPYHDMWSIFLSAERFRSRRYGSTAALRLLVQPYDEDDDDYYYFLSFST